MQSLLVNDNYVKLKTYEVMTKDKPPKHLSRDQNMEGIIDHIVFVTVA